MSGGGNPSHINSWVGLKTRRRTSALGHCSASAAHAAGNQQLTGSSTCFWRPLIMNTTTMICTEPSLLGFDWAWLMGVLLIAFSLATRPPRIAIVHRGMTVVTSN
jgi:hypothetical protein